MPEALAIKRVGASVDYGYIIPQKFSFFKGLEELYLRQYNAIVQDGKLTVRKNEDKAKRERHLQKDKSMQKAYVCLHCEKKECVGTEKCFAKEERNRG